MVRSRLFTFALLAGALCSPSYRRAAADTVLLDFTQESCGPCIEMEPVLRQLADQGCQIQKVDVQREPEVARKFRVDATPTFIVLVDGREWARVTGKTQHAVMVEMLQKAESLAAAHAPRAQGPNGGGSVAPVGFNVPTPGAATAPGAPRTPAAAGPQEGRVVPIQDPFAASAPRRTAAAPQSATTGSAASRSLQAGADTAHLIAATVRLSITDAGGKSTGTGAIVDARNGMALVLTCGHLFRESKGQGPIAISIFTLGPNGAELRGEVAGELYAYDLERDLALVRFRTESPVSVTPVAPPGTQLEPGAPVTSVGCSHGENPTARATHITSLNRYQGFPNVEAAGAPVEGRSGGGLFNAQGQLIGICYAADPEGDEGLYASLASIHAKLDELQLASVYLSPGTDAGVGQAPLAGQLAAGVPAAGIVPAEEQFAVRGQNPAPTSSTTLPGNWPAPAAPAATAPPQSAPVAAAEAGALANLTPNEQATLQEIARRSSGAEVICIIRPQTPDGRSDVITLSGVSPAFVQALTASAKNVTVGAGTTTAAPPATAVAPGNFLR